jgi:opacity protein-like surface antigen
MRFFRQSIIIAALLAGITAVPGAAEAQDERIIVNFTPAFATVSGDTDLALAASAGYRFTEHLWFEGDFTWIDAAAGGDYGVFPFGGSEFTSTTSRDLVTGTLLTFGSPASDRRTFPNFPGIPIPIEGYEFASEGRTMIGTIGVRYEPTVQTARFRPYVSGGLGFNRTEQEVTFRIATVLGFDDTVSHAGVAFSAGGGASVRLFSSLWAGADAKYFRLSRDRNIIRFGGNIGLRF